MAENVSQTRPPDQDRFEFPDLREFVAAADSLKLPDSVEVYCLVDERRGRRTVFSLSTLSGGRGAAEDEPAITPTAPAAPESTSTTRTSVSQNATGRVVTGRRRGRKYTARALTLGDVRSLIARVDEVGLRTDSYTNDDGVRHGVEIRGYPSLRSGGKYVHEISATPFP